MLTICPCCIKLAVFASLCTSVRDTWLWQYVVFILLTITILFYVNDCDKKIFHHYRGFKLVGTHDSCQTTICISYFLYLSTFMLIFFFRLKCFAAGLWKRWSSIWFNSLHGHFRAFCFWHERWDWSRISWRIWCSKSIYCPLQLLLPR